MPELTPDIVNDDAALAACVDALIESDPGASAQAAAINKVATAVRHRLEAASWGEALELEAKINARWSDLAVVIARWAFEQGVRARENADVDDLDLNGAQLPLLWAISQSAPAVPLVAVVISAQPKTFGAGLWTPAGVGKANALLGGFGALLAAWRPGEEGGNAVVDILTGAYNPSGRLSHTWPAKAGQVHSTFATAAELLPTQAGGTFPFTTGPPRPLFPLGFGLSFSTFSVDAAAASPPASGTQYGSSEPFTISANVSSVGPSGALTLQVYWAFVAIDGAEAKTVGVRSQMQMQF